MSTITLANQLTMLEIIKRTDPNGNLATIAEVMTKVNTMLEDAPMVECNRMTMHEMTVRTALPTGERRKFNAGVGSGASQTKKITEATTMVEKYSAVDVALNGLEPNPALSRSNEDMTFIEGLAQGQATDLIYGTATGESEGINGLAVRLASKAKSNVKSHGDSSALTSILIVQWGINKVFLLYPKGSKTAGVQHTDLTKGMPDGMAWVDPADATKRFQAFVSHFKTHYGLGVKDERCIARVGDIDTADLDGFDEDYLIYLLNKMPDKGKGSVIYCNTDMMTLFDIRAKNKTNVSYGANNVWGLPQMLFKGQFPIKQMDAITSAETALSA